MSASIQIQAAYPEAPLVHMESLYYAEYDADVVRRVSLASVLRDGHEPPSESCMLPCGSGPCGLAFCAGMADVVVACYGSHELRALSSGKVLHRVPFANDLCADDRSGGVFVTSSAASAASDAPGDPFDPNAPATGAVYHLSPCGRELIALTPPCIRYANGVAYDPARDRLFVSEHLRNRVLVYDIQPVPNKTGHCTVDQQVNPCTRTCRRRRRRRSERPAPS